MRAAGLRARNDGFFNYTAGIPIQKIFARETIMNTFVLVPLIGADKVR